MFGSPRQQMTTQVFKPGDEAPVSGVYLVAHWEHRAEHEVTLRAGEQFPACSSCHEQVRFRLHHQAEEIRSDADFAG